MSEPLRAFIPFDGGPDPTGNPAGDPPGWMSEVGQSVWRRLAQEVKPTTAEVDEFACFCEAVAEFREATEHLTIAGLILTNDEGEYANPAVGIRDTADGKIARWAKRFRR